MCSNMVTKFKDILYAHAVIMLITCHSHLNSILFTYGIGFTMDVVLASVYMITTCDGMYTQMPELYLMENDFWHLNAALTEV